jgi:hypothetical protein
MLANVKLVPDVEATAVPDVIALDCPETNTVPLVAGNVSTVVPATAGASNVIEPLVSPAIVIALMLMLLLILLFLL